jgi:serine/threonine protein kinase
VKDEHWQKVKRIVGECLERPVPERDVYIAETCGENMEIADEVKSLLASFSEAGEFLETPVVMGEESEDLVAGQQIGSYRVVELIGHGGMGSVYRAARTSDFLKEVAVKVVKRGMDTDFILSRFRQERQILAALDHPNIARLLDGGATIDGRPYIVMELVVGQPITEYAAKRHLNVEERLRLFQTVCSAVQHAHQNLVVHRDLKANNILVTEDGVPKLLDFGIAKLLEADSQQTAAVIRLMTPECASPEQVRGEPLNTLSDIYSLGVLLYELLTEAKPYRFATTDPVEIQRVVCGLTPTLPSAVRPLAGDMDNIVLKAMHKDPSQRYVSAAQISEDIGRHLAGQPVIAGRDSLRYRAGKFVRRHLAATLAVAAIFLSLTAGLGVSLWEAHLARI